MALKRKQYFIKQYKFSNLKVNGSSLEFLPEDAIEVQNSENILYSTYFRIKDIAYINNDKNNLDELFILNAANISTKEEDGQLEFYKKIMREGVYIDGDKFIRFGKSSSMTMNQRTLFVKEELHKELKEHISLGKTPSETVISKYETALGLSLSSLNLIDCLPRIAIVPDFEKIVIDDVKMVTKFQADENDPDYKKFKEIEAKENDYKNELNKTKELHTNAYLRENFPLSTQDDCFSRSKWNRKGKRVMEGELSKPQGYKVFNNNVYAVYQENQTEEVPNLLNKFTLGYDIKVVEDHENKIIPFDGQGLVSSEYAKKLSGKLKLKHISNGFQIRMPYIKSLVINFDFKSWFHENGVTHITDLWEDSIEVNKLDIILTESCFKAKMEAAEGKNKWLFSSIEDYINLLKGYGHKYIGVTNYIKSTNDTDIYTTLNYQFINSLNLSASDLSSLTKKAGSLYMKVLKHGDTAAVKALLKMVVNEDDSESRLDIDVQKAIDVNARMIFDPRVQAFLRNRVYEALKDMLIGRIPVKADYKFITGDCIAFMEYISNKPVNGFLKKNEFYCKGKQGEYVMMRNPLTSWHEVKNGNFINAENKFVEHLDNVVQLNSWDLTMPQLSGADVDGDKIFLSRDPLLRKAVLEDLVIVNEDDKTTAPAFKYDKENVINFELKNLSNLTPVVTNINTLIQSHALEKGNLRESELAIATCKQLQAEFIDSVKKGTNPIIPEILLDMQNNKPYFQKFVYEDMGDKSKDYKYLNIDSPLNLLCEQLEIRIEKLKEERFFSTEYLDVSTYDLITDMSKIDQETFFDLVEKIVPIYNDYSKKKGEIWKEEKGIKKVRAKDEDKEKLKLVKTKYKDLFKETKERLFTTCDNKSVLTTVCAYIEYKASKSSNVKDKSVVRTKSYVFPWICTDDAEGLLENLKVNEDKIKVDIKEVPELDRLDKEYEGILTVKDGIASVEGVSFNTNLNNGIYRLFNQMGYHFIDFDNTRESDIEICKSYAIPFNKENAGKKEITAYKCRLVGLESGAATSLDINSKIVSIGLNGNYLGIFLDGKYICGIAQENYIDEKQRIFLKDYIGTEFKIRVEKESKRSLTVDLLAV